MPINLFWIVSSFYRYAATETALSGFLFERQKGRTDFCASCIFHRTMVCWERVVRVCDSHKSVRVHAWLIFRCILDMWLHLFRYSLAARKKKRKKKAKQRKVRMKVPIGDHCTQTLCPSVLCCCSFVVVFWQYIGQQAQQTPPTGAPLPQRL